MNTIAVVILNWNGNALLEQFLPYIIKFSEGAAIYVADNASTDSSVAYIKQNYPHVNIIRNKGNYGYAKGYNEALHFVKEDIYALVNSDVEVTEGWLVPVLELFEADLQTAIIQPKILDFYNKESFEYAGAAGGFIDKYGYPFCRGRIFNTIEHDTEQYNDTSEIFWASGACLFIRKSVFRELGGFDSDFYAHQEEIDLCWRAFNANHKARFCHTSVIYHVGGATLSSSSPKKTYLNFKNSLLMLIKNLPANRLFPVIFIRLCYDGLAGIRFISQLKFGHTWAIIKAHYYMYFNLYRFLHKRQGNKYNNYFKCNSIVYQYFVKKNKIFSKNFNNSL